MSALDKVFSAAFLMVVGGAVAAVLLSNDKAADTLAGAAIFMVLLRFLLG